MISKVGIIVATLGKRNEYLEQCLRSIRLAGDSYILLVAPSYFDAAELLKAKLIDESLADAGSGLAEAINLGIRSLPPEIEFVNWLNDDDLLSENSLNITASLLKSDPATVMVFGACDYIDAHGEKVWTNKSGQWAVPLMRFGPDLIPQPGALFRRSSFDKVGGLNPQFDWAFDFDLFIRFSKLGRLRHLKTTLASFRWHPGSLSVGHRLMSVNEASEVRVRHLPKLLRQICLLWEYPLRQATLIAGYRLSKRVNTKAAKR